MRYQIVSDSSSNIFRMEGVSYTTVPMKIIAGEKEYVDTESLDVRGMVDDLKAYKGKSGSSCANAQEWLEAFGDADMVFGITISRNLSGSFNAAQQAAQDFAEEHPNAKIHIFDTLSAGPEMAMVAEKIHELVNKGLAFEEIVAQVREYQNHCHILFCLESMNNLARNGRVNPAVAKLASVLGIRACGDAQNGQIVPTQKPRGQKKATETLAAMIRERGFRDDAWLRIAHCFGETQARLLIDALKKDFPNARYTLEPTGALCSFYAEEGGLMIAMEGAFNQVNNVNDI
ncbi:MAG: DegV family EDD domain-containing protein [Oscillospiraceae bacterium]|nr:DegV family EDD domain-containing protein [Oscillospiraceae bacterium]